MMFGLCCKFVLWFLSYNITSFHLRLTFSSEKVAFLLAKNLNHNGAIRVFRSHSNLACLKLTVQKTMNLSTLSFLQSKWSLFLKTMCNILSLGFNAFIPHRRMDNEGFNARVVFLRMESTCLPDKPYPLARTIYLWMSQKTVCHETKQMAVFCYYVPIRCYRWCCKINLN